MKKQQSKFTLILMPFFLVFLITSVATAETEHPHTISKNSKSTTCALCHKVIPSVSDKEVGVETRNNPVDRDSFVQDGTAMCSSCHNPDDGHKVGLELDFQAPADLPLDAKNKMTCLTCHYTHGSLTTERPQASFSFMDRLFDADRLHKSFLLRRNNADGELCLTCHTVNQGSK
jgi:hypothetical protein